MADDEQLQQTLQQLHEELSSAHSVDPKVRELLTTTLADIQRVLESQENSSSDDDESEEDHPEGIVDRLSDAAKHFEESHPTVAGTMGQLADILAQMGI